MDYFVIWREDFEEYHGFVSKRYLDALITRIAELDGEGEAEITRIIQGQDVTETYKVGGE